MIKRLYRFILKYRYPIKHIDYEEVLVWQTSSGRIWMMDDEAEFWHRYSI